MARTMAQTAAELRIALGPMTRAQFAGLIGAIRDEHTERTGCKTMGPGRSNRERTNQRRVTTLTLSSETFPASGAST